MIVVDQVLEVQRDLRGVKVGEFTSGGAVLGVLLMQARLAGGDLAHHRAIQLLVMIMIVIDLQSGIIIIIVCRGVIVLITGIVIEHLGLLQFGRTLGLGLMGRRIVHDR